jgi:hypothetical protein
VQRWGATEGTWPVFNDKPFRKKLWAFSNGLRWRGIRTVHPEPRPPAHLRFHVLPPIRDDGNPSLARELCLESRHCIVCQTYRPCDSAHQGVRPPLVDWIGYLCPKASTRRTTICNHDSGLARIPSQTAVCRRCYLVTYTLLPIVVRIGQAGPPNCSSEVECLTMGRLKIRGSAVLLDHTFESFH